MTSACAFSNPVSAANLCIRRKPKVIGDIYLELLLTSVRMSLSFAKMAEVHAEREFLFILREKFSAQ